MSGSYRRCIVFLQMNFRQDVWECKFRSVCYQKYQPHLKKDQDSFVPFPTWDVQFDNQIIQAWRETVLQLAGKLKIFYQLVFFVLFYFVFFFLTFVDQLFDMSMLSRT